VSWLRGRATLVPLSTLLLASFALFGAIFLISLYLQDIRGYSPVQAGVRMLPLTLSTLCVAPTAGKLATRLGTMVVFTGGLALTAAATGTLTQLTLGSGYGWFGVRLCALGIGLALALPSAVALLLDNAPADRVGTASGVITMGRQFGGALGLAVLASVGSHAAGDAFVHATGLGSLRAVVAGGRIDEVARLAGPRAANLATESFLRGFTVAMWLATGAVALSLLITLAFDTRAGSTAARTAEPLAQRR
jgi:hypothetical protein